MKMTNRVKEVIILVGAVLVMFGGLRVIGLGLSWYIDNRDKITAYHRAHESKYDSKLAERIYGVVDDEAFLASLKQNNITVDQFMHTWLFGPDDRSFDVLPPTSRAAILAGEAHKAAKKSL